MLRGRRSVLLPVLLAAPVLILAILGAEGPPDCIPVPVEPPPSDCELRGGWCVEPGESGIAVDCPDGYGPADLSCGAAGGNCCMPLPAPTRGVCSPTKESALTMVTPSAGPTICHGEAPTTGNADSSRRR